MSRRRAQPLPIGNVGAPINVSGTIQYKSGALGIGGVLRGYSNAIFDGNVGIGTTSPGSKLHILGASDNLLQLQRSGAANPVIFKEGTDSTLVINAGNSDVLAMKSGNVGIGTTSPTAKLDVAGSIRLRPTSAPSGANGAMYYDSSLNKFRCYQNGSWADCSGAGSGLAGSGTVDRVAKWTGTTSLGSSQIFDNNTNVGIGTTSPTAKLDVAGPIGFDNQKVCYWAEFTIPGDYSSIISTTIPTPNDWRVRDCARVAYDACSGSNKSTSNCMFQLACFGKSGKHTWTQAYQASSFVNYSSGSTFTWYKPSGGYFSDPNFCGWDTGSDNTWTGVVSAKSAECVYGNYTFRAAGEKLESGGYRVQATISGDASCDSGWVNGNTASCTSGNYKATTRATSLRLEMYGYEGPRQVCSKYVSW
jgi:hypothetical protein